MIEFAGYQMPLQYTEIQQEDEATKKGVGILDASHMGKILIHGKDAFDLVQMISLNKSPQLTAGTLHYSCMSKSKGIIDDLMVYSIGEKGYLLVVNASKIRKVMDWILLHTIPNAEVTNVTDTMTLMIVQGPKALHTLQKLTDIYLEGIDCTKFKIGELACISKVMISSSGYLGARGFEIFVENKYAEHVWDAILKAGKDDHIVPVGLAARDTLRLEMGFFSLWK
ncbi:hypothetical protein K0U91_00905 [Chryseobacterium chendengshani]|nr:hypothetical protein [Chryseobacterium sp. LJ668]MBW8523782.1 hypothetical protein [Chryseobacterium sp. LJ668]QYK16726.1 hypothetical protein K0U91_00905 [Chryseobacterium sp. LJ668]